MQREFSALILRLREFFTSRGYMEVFTPILNEYPNIDANIEPISVEVRRCGNLKKMWLHTSPEPAMKRLLVNLKQNIFQIARVFRNSECGKRNLIEFTMLEWYKIEANYKDLIDEVFDLLRFLGFNIDGAIPLEEAFYKYLGIDSLEDGLIEKARALGIDALSWEEAFYGLYAKLEGFLGFNGALAIYDFPPKAGCYSKITNSRAERFEIYLNGIELANGWSEETDPSELLSRARVFAGELKVDEEFFSLCGNLPRCAGCSLGVERLLMLFYNLDSLEGFSILQ
ncbi:MAG: elongation factor P--(R)-beta-lysine ligase [Aquificaceae bacterium]|nr:elongation factor P--(R)-beta-lysine ligase [Aquificaceae bacterium]MDW8237698.1 amino acid--tRNA ligase-related protein [Aquificaceae bacterium]